MKNIYAWENLENIYEKRKNILTRLSVFFFSILEFLILNVFYWDIFIVVLKITSSKLFSRKFYVIKLSISSVFLALYHIL